MRISLLLAACLLLIACQSVPSGSADPQQEFRAHITPYLGKATYSEIVERAGIPTRKDPQPDGGLIAEWTVTQGGGWIAAPGLPVAGGSLPALAVPISSGQTIRLRFDREHRLISGNMLRW